MVRLCAILQPDDSMRAVAGLHLAPALHCLYMLHSPPHATL